MCKYSLPPLFASFFFVVAFVIQNLDEQRKRTFEGVGRRDRTGKPACFHLFWKGQSIVAEGENN